MYTALRERLKNSKDYIDSLLTRIAEKDDREAFNQFFILYYNRLIQFALLFVHRQEIAEDIVSDVLVQLLRRKKELNQINHFEGYLFLSVKNTALNFLKKEKRHSDYCNSEVNEVFLPAHISDPVEKVLEEELRHLIFRTVERLPKQRKMVYKLIKDEGLKYKEVADLLDISIKTVENHLDLAVKEIRAVVENYLDRKPSTVPAYKLAKILIMLSLGI